MRQKALLDIRKNLKNRGLSLDSLFFYDTDITRVLKNTSSPILKKSLEKNHRIHAIKFDNFAGILTHPTQPGKTFASELAGRVRVIACLDDIPNLFHTDVFPEYPRSHIDFNAIKKAMKVGENDVCIIVWGSESEVMTAKNEIVDRIKEAFVGVPNETRQALRGGLTDFERILPGADRMYPDTDHPPIALSAERIAAIKENLKDPAYKIEDRFRKYGIPEDAIPRLALSPYIDLIEKLHDDGVSMKIAGRILGQTARYLLRKDLDISTIGYKKLGHLIALCDDKKIPAKFFDAILENAAAYPEYDAKRIISMLSMDSD